MGNSEKKMTLAEKIGLKIDEQIDRYMDYLAAECGLADNTMEAYGRDLQHLRKFLCDAKLYPRKVKPGQLDGYAHFLMTVEQKRKQKKTKKQKKGLSVASIARHVSSMRMFFKFLAAEGLIKQNPSNLVEAPGVWNKIPETLTIEQVDQLLSVRPESGLELRDCAILEMLYATGARASEVSGANVQDAKLRFRFMRLIGKGSRERIVPLAGTAAARIGEYMDEVRPLLEKPHSGTALFLSKTGKRLCRGDIWRIVRKTAKKVGIREYFSTHTLRHCFATHLLERGADLRSVQEMLGHVNVTATEKYTHIDRNRLKAIHQKYHPRG